MTSRTGTTEHPDVSEISDLTEGLLPPAHSAEVREHLDGCALCADVHNSIEEIRGLLGSLPGPPSMPPEVAARIDGALAAEALLRATLPETADALETASDVSRETLPSPRTSIDVPAARTADSPKADRPAGHSRAATGPGRIRQVRRRRRAILGTVFGTAAIGVGVLLLQSFQDGFSADKRADSSTSQAQNGNSAVFSGSALRAKVDSLLASTPMVQEPRAAESGNAPMDGPSSLASPELQTGVPPCVQQGTGRTEPPLASERGTFEGTDAFLVVLSDPTDMSRVQAYVIDAACVDHTPPTKGDVLLSHSYPRR